MPWSDLFLENTSQAPASFTDETQGVAICGLSQESSGSNAVSLVESVTAAAVGAAIKATK